MMDTRLKILAALPFVFIMTVLFTVSRIDLERFVLRPAERRMLHFSPDKSEMGIVRSDPAAKSVSLRLMNFFSPVISAKEAPSTVGTETPLAGSAPQQDAGAEPHETEADQTDRKEKGSPGVAGDNSQKNPKLTFVVLNNKRSIAIVDNHLLHEGDSFGGITVRKIEQDRVLLGDKRLRWIYMMEEKK